MATTSYISLGNKPSKRTVAFWDTKTASFGSARLNLASFRLFSLPVLINESISVSHHVIPHPKSLLVWLRRICRTWKQLHQNRWKVYEEMWFFFHEHIFIMSPCAPFFPTCFRTRPSFLVILKHFRDKKISCLCSRSLIKNVMNFFIWMSYSFETIHILQLTTNYFRW